ncbi:MAG: hypothetical protein A4E35_00816 [Methanoregula sp. PtaU1.Bin051]|nr:MAG: hypothetical protein A4E35_00816 [Methanoregula sp. PtaU1.Bin051]
MIPQRALQRSKLHLQQLDLLLKSPIIHPLLLLVLLEYARSR